MKPKYIICLIFSCIAMLALYTIAYQLSYKINYNDKSRGNPNNNSTSSSNDILNLTKDNVQADTNIETTIKSTTEFVVERYYLDDYSLIEEKRSVPVDLLGNKREDVIKYLKEYSDSPSIEDIKQGMVSYELIAFTKEKVVLRKTYKKPEVVYEYYLKAENNYITIYYIDKKTVYDYTSICVDDLPKAVKSEVNKGKCIETIVDLYDFLESYSS